MPRLKQHKSSTRPKRRVIRLRFLKYFCLFGLVVLFKWYLDYISIASNSILPQQQQDEQHKLANYAAPTKDDWHAQQKIVKQRAGKHSELSAEELLATYNSNNNRSLPSAGFVHIGKTAGSTLSLLLRNGCHSFVPKPCQNVTEPESPVSKIVDNYYHVPDFHTLPESQHDIYILSIRDVFERTLSSFLYLHPQNVRHYHVQLSRHMLRQLPIAYKCFPTLESWAILQTNEACFYPDRHNVVNATNCTRLACGGLHGKVRPYVHLYFNYQNLYAKLPLNRNRQLYVIRKEKLWQDWKTVNDMLGERDDRNGKTAAANDTPDNKANDATEIAARNITHLDLPVGKELSKVARMRLCGALVSEYETYFKILHVAINMQPSDVEWAKAVAQTNCPYLDYESMIQKSTQ